MSQLIPRPFDHGGEQLPRLSLGLSPGPCGIGHNTCSRIFKGARTIVDERKILIVEDNPTDEALLLRALKKAGITNPLVTVHDGLEAVHYLFATGRYEFREPTDLPAIVLVDLNLP